MSKPRSGAPKSMWEPGSSAWQVGVASLDLGPVIGRREIECARRALLTNPKLLIMDEPSEGLAPIIVENVIDTISKLAAHGVGLLVVEQNLGVATALADRQLVMVDGRIATETTAQELIGNIDAQRRYLGVEPPNVRQS
jgi:branched-chain amino acid transport system ATP-binding protein